MSAFHGQFVQHLTASAASYTNIEAAIASFLHDLNLSAEPFVNFIKSTPPNVLLGNAVLTAAAILLTPIWLPVAIFTAIFLAVSVVFVLYLNHELLF